MTLDDKTTGAPRASCTEAHEPHNYAAGESPLDAVVQAIYGMQVNELTAGSGTKSGSTALRIFGRRASLLAGRKSGQDSQLEYSTREQTILFFDWDDTLFPTQWLNTLTAAAMGSSVHVTKKDKNMLNHIAASVEDLLSVAMTLGHVAIVTNARRPWVAVTREKFLKRLPVDLLKKIQVFYAQEEVTEEATEKAVRGESCPKAHFTETKFRAMHAAVSSFYSRYPGQSWKNVVSVGDSDFEHDAIRKVVEDRPNPDRKCRSKTVKFIDGPSLEELYAQIKILTNWLPSIVLQDADVDVSYQDTDKAALLRAQEAHGTSSNQGPHRVCRVSETE